jgi:hypothetical protein
MNQLLSHSNIFPVAILIDWRAVICYEGFNQATMRFDSTPPALMDLATSVFDSSGGGPLQPKQRMEQIALKLSEKSLEQKLELTDNLTSALTTNLAVFALPNPTTVVLNGKATAIRAKLVAISDADAVLTKLNQDLSTMEDDLDANLTSEAAYIMETTKGAPDKLALLPVELKGHGTNPITPGAILGFRLSPGVNVGEVKAESKPTDGAISYEHQMIPDITKPDVAVMLESSPGCRTMLNKFTSGAHVWIQRRAVGGKKAGKGPWCAPSVVTVP